MHMHRLIYSKAKHIIIPTLLLCLAGGAILFPADSGKVLGATDEASASLTYRWENSLVRINGEIQILESETLEESLQLLSEIEMFYTFGTVISPDSIDAIFPLDGSVGYQTVYQVLSNRRFLKILHQLANESPERAAKLLGEQIRLNLAEYETVILKDILNSPRLHNKHETFNSGWSFRISDYEDGTPTFQGLRHSLFAMVMIAGILEIEDTRDAITQVLQTAVEHRDFFYGRDKNGLNPALSAGALRRASLYNRQVLAIGLLGVSGNPEALTPRLQESLARFTEEDPSDVEPQQKAALPNFDTITNPYELPSMGEDVPIDFSKGKISFSYAPFISDSDFDFIVNSFSHIN